MSEKDTIEVRCPLCGHVFKFDPTTASDEQIIYRGDPVTGGQYRLRCPVDHTYFIVTIPPMGGAQRGENAP